MPQSSYRRFAVLSRGRASLAEVACLLQTVAKVEASSFRSSSALGESATQQQGHRHSSFMSKSRSLPAHGNNTLQACNQGIKYCLLRMNLQ